MQGKVQRQAAREGTKAGKKRYKNKAREWKKDGRERYESRQRKTQRR